MTNKDLSAFSFLTIKGKKIASIIFPIHGHLPSVHQYQVQVRLRVTLSRPKMMMLTDWYLLTVRHTTLTNSLFLFTFGELKVSISSLDLSQKYWIFENERSKHLYRAPYINSLQLWKYCFSKFLTKRANTLLHIYLVDWFATQKRTKCSVSSMRIIIVLLVWAWTYIVVVRSK